MGAVPVQAAAIVSKSPAEAPTTLPPMVDADTQTENDSPSENATGKTPVDESNTINWYKGRQGRATFHCKNTAEGKCVGKYSLSSPTTLVTS